MPRNHEYDLIGVVGGCKCDLIWKDTKSLEIKLSWIRVAPKSNGKSKRRDKRDHKNRIVFINQRPPGKEGVSF